MMMHGLAKFKFPAIFRSQIVITRLTPAIAGLPDADESSQQSPTLFKIIVPITLPSTPSSFKSSFSFWVSNQKPQSICSPFCKSHAPPHPSHSA